MIFFVLLPFLFLFFSFFKENRFLLIFSGFILLLLSGFRGVEVGTDTVNYQKYFLIIQESGILDIEPLWLLLNKQIIALGGEFSDVILITSLLVIVPLIYVVHKRSDNVFLSLFFYYTLYFFFFSFNITRQLIAVSIILLSFQYLLEGGRWKFVVLVILASLFHYSAIVVLPLLLQKRIPTSFNFTVNTVIIASIIGLLVPSSLIAVSEVIGYSSYFSNFEYGNVTGNAIYLLILNSFFIFVSVYIKEKNILFKIFFISIIVSNLLIRVPFGGRVILYFSIIQILLLPFFIYNNKIKQKYLLTFIVLLYAFVMFFYKLGDGGIFPYTNTLLE